MPEKPNEITLLYLDALKDLPDGPKTRAFVKKVCELIQQAFDKLDKLVINDDIKKDIVEAPELVKSWLQNDLALPELERLNKHLWQELIGARGECITAIRDLEYSRKTIYDILTDLTDACLELSRKNKDLAFKKLVDIVNRRICNLKLYAEDASSK